MLPKPGQSVVSAPSGSRVRSIARLEEVTPARLRSAKRAAESGQPADLFSILAFFLAYDDEIPAALESLLGACLQDTPDVEPTDESDEAARQAEVCQKALDDLDLVALCEELLLAHYLPAKCAQPMWDGWGYEGATYQMPVTYEMLPDHWLHAERYQGSDVTQMMVGRLPYHAYDKGALLLHTSGKLPSYQDIDFTRFGKGLAAARFAIYAWFNYSDWSGYNEVVGIPTIIGTLLEGYGEKDEKVLREAVYGIASNSRGIKTERTQIEALKIERAAGLFSEFADNISRVRAKVIKGEALTDGPTKVGSFAASRTSNGIRVDVAQRINTRLERLLTRRLLAPMLDLNFARPLCRISLPVRRAQSQAERTQAFEAGQRLGLDLSREQLRRELGITAPRDDDDTLPARTTFNPFGA